MIQPFFNKKNILNLLILGVIIFLFRLLFNENINSKFGVEGTITVENNKRDLAEILKDGKLNVLIENSTTSFFVYRGKSMGFEYEILKEFTKHLGVELELNFIENLENVEDQLNNFEGDIISCNYTKTKKRKENIDFSVPYFYAKQVLIQRLPDNWSNMSPDEIKESMIKDPIELAGKNIYINNHSSYYTRLKNLEEEIGDSIYIQTDYNDFSTEELIEMVSDGIIDYTVVEDNIAELNKRFFDNLNIDIPLSSNQKIAFGLRKTSPLLRENLNSWLKEFMKTTAFKFIEHKYFIAQKFSNIASSSKGSEIPHGNLSPFDSFFKKSANKHKIDWRLMASIAYQESKFNPTIISFGGAYGMMQFMPGTGEKYKVYKDSPPNVQIEGATAKVKSDLERWKEIPDIQQREKFAIATYNAGFSHIKDAQNLARKHHLNPLVWDDNVEIMVKNLGKKEFYRDPVVKAGAMKGDHTSNYVRSVIKRYNNYKQTYR